MWEGGYEGPHGLFLKTTDRGVRYPLTPGHEIAGIIENMGDEAKEKFIKTLFSLEAVQIKVWELRPGRFGGN